MEKLLKYKTKTAFFTIYSIFICAKSFGSFPAVFNLMELNGNNGFTINGVSTGDKAGVISAIGDVNGDGIDDILIGALGANCNTGKTYVLFGSKQEWPEEIDLISLNGNNGFVINGNNEGDSCGSSVSGIGDINGDGINDFLIGAAGANNYTGQIYVIFGSKNLWPKVINLIDLNGKDGFIINGINLGDEIGTSASGSGDINGDGIDDFLIGAPLADGSGQVYAVFGSEKPWSPYFDLNNLNGKNGFVIQGMEVGCSFVNGGGDVNGDGIDDILIYSDLSYVIFGKELWPAYFNLDDINGVNGFTINGYNPSGVGDVNGDGLNDILINSFGTDFVIGQSCIVFGSKELWHQSIDIKHLDGKNGFIINGIYLNKDAHFGFSLSGAGDLNGDDIDDILIGAPRTNNTAGQSCVIFGRKKLWPPIINIDELNGSNGFVINGKKAGDYSGIIVRKAGDVNGDSIDDILISALRANNYIGQTYIVFGKKSSIKNQPK